VTTLRWPDPHSRWRRAKALLCLAIATTAIAATTTTLVVQLLSPDNKSLTPPPIDSPAVATTDGARHCVVLLLRQTESAVASLRILEQRSDEAAQHATIAIRHIHEITASR
jgi:hypothetical protein